MEANLTAKIEELTRQRNDFQERLEKHLYKNIGNLKRMKYVLSREMHQTALSLLKLKKGTKCKEGARLKFWVHEKFYSKDGLLRCKKTHKPVAVKEELFHIIHEVHGRIGHKKKRDVSREVYRHYAYIKRDIVDIYISTCELCRQGPMEPTKEQPVVKPEEAGFMHRIVVSIVNMEDMPDGGFRFILLVRDCATSFLTAWPMRDVEDEMVSCLLQHFGQFGPAKFVHFVDTGRADIDTWVDELKRFWPGLKVQAGIWNYQNIERMCARACADIQSRLGAWMTQVESDSWSKGLGSSVFQMNSVISSVLKVSPLKSVFCQALVEPDVQWKAALYLRYKTEGSDNLKTVISANKKLVKGVDATTSTPIDMDTANDSSSSMDENDYKVYQTSENESGDSPLFKITNVQSDTHHWNCSGMKEQTDDIDLEVKVEQIDVDFEKHQQE